MAESTKVALRFIQPIDGLTVREHLGNGKSFSPHFYLTNDARRIAQLLDDPNLAILFGRHFTKATKDSGAVFYLECDTAVNSEEELASLTSDPFVRECEEFLLSLWILKDHAAGLPPAVLRISPQGKESRYRITCFGDANFDSIGENRPVEFSSEEIGVATEYYQDCLVQITRQSVGKPPPQTVNSQTNFERKSSRLLRFLCLLLRARTIRDLGMRLGLYCSCLECLFSREKTEVTHRVSERTAFFLDRTTSGRREIYELVDLAYNIRSAVLHGSIIGDKNCQKLLEISPKIDEVLRRTFSEFVLNQRLRDMFGREDCSESDKKIQEYFLDQLFSKDSQVAKKSPVD